MKIVDLYNQTPAANRGNIRVVGDRVFVKDNEGLIDEYVISATEDGDELWLVRSGRDIQAIKSKLGIG